MEEFTSHFFKVIIKICQHSRQLLNLAEIKKLIDGLVNSKKLVVVANSLPLFLVTSMFFSSEQINETESTVNSIFEMILTKIEEVKQTAVTNTQPLLTYYRICNLITTYTSLLRYLLCF